MKKILAKVIALVMIINMIIPNGINVFANNEMTSPLISVINATAAPGDEVEVKINIENNTGILGATLKIEYDSKLSLIEANNGDAFSYLSMTKPGKYDSPCRFVWDGVDYTGTDLKSGTILILKFKVSENVVDGEKINVSVSAGNNDIYDNELNPIKVTTENGSISIINATPGDVNGDEQINTGDIIMVRRYIAGGYNISMNVHSANVNADEYINSADVITLRRYVAGGYNVELKSCPTPCPLDTVTDEDQSEHTHALKGVAYKTPTCTEIGHIAYWKCSECGKYFSDVEGKNEITAAKTVLEAKGHTPVIIPAVAPTAYEKGWTEGTKCDECGIVIVEPKPIEIPTEDMHTITYYISNGDAYLATQEIDNKNPSHVANGSSITLKNLNVDGYTFLGWYDGAGKNAEQIKTLSNITDDIELYAHWEAIPYDVIFEYDNSLVDKIDTSKLENVTYTTNKTTSLPVLSLTGYTFVGWSDEDGNVCTQISKGNSGEKKYYANFMSRRNRAWAKKKLDAPISYKDDNVLLYAYEIGKVEDVPVCEIEDFGYINAGGLAQSVTKTVSIQTSNQYMNSYSSSIEKSTTGNATWTLSKGWTDSITISEEYARSQGKTVEEVASESKTDTGMYYVNKTTGGSSSNTEVDSTDTYNLLTTTNNTTDYNSGQETEYNNKTNTAGYEENAKVSISASGEIMGVAKMSANTSYEFTSDYSTTSKTGTDTVTKNGSDTSNGNENQTGDITKHTTNTTNTSTWNNESGYSNSETNSVSNSIAKAISESVNEKTGYGSTYINTGDTTETQGLASTNANKDEFSSYVTTSNVKYEEQEVSYTTGTAVSGYHRWVMAATAHVYGVVGYDIANKEYFVYTYSIMDDNYHKFEDYSYQTANYDDNENSIIDFEIPSEILDLVKSQTFGTEGLEYDKNGVVTAYNGKDSAVIIPNYISVDNKDGSREAIKVTGIAEGVFTGNEKITGVVLSDFITEIPDSEFKGCKELWEVVGNGITSIGEYAFDGCEKLHSGRVSKEITYLGKHAFDGAQFIEVDAANAEVAVNAASSGAKEICVSIQNVDDSLEKLEMIVPEGTVKFTLRGYNKSCKDMKLISDAEETILNRVVINSYNEIPLHINSKEISICQSKIKAKGVAAVMNGTNTKINLYGESSIATDGVNAIFVRNLELAKIEGNLYTELNVPGDIVTCNNAQGSIDYLRFANGSIRIVDTKTFEDMLNSYKLYFNANGGNCAETEREVSSGEILGQLPTPKKEYFTFAGWYTEANGGVQVTSDSVFSTGSDITIYAHWNQNYYNMTFDSNGGTCDQKSKIGICGDKVGNLPNPTWDYHTFIGWYDGTNQITSSTVIDSTNDITLIAKWKDNDISGWVLETNVPSGGKIVDQQWTYTKRSYTTSSNSSKSGWNLYDTKRTSWGATQGPVYSDPSNNSRNVWSEQYVSATKTVYHYYRYASVNAQIGGDSSYTNYGSCQNYVTLDLDYELSYNGSLNGNYIYKGYWYWKCSTYTTSEPSAYGTRWYYQEPIYTYYFYQDNSLTSSSVPTGNDISNVTKWVKYQSK